MRLPPMYTNTLQHVFFPPSSLAHISCSDRPPMPSRGIHTTSSSFACLPCSVTAQASNLSAPACALRCDAPPASFLLPINCGARFFAFRQTRASPLVSACVTGLATWPMKSNHRRSEPYNRTYLNALLETSPASTLNGRRYALSIRAPTHRQATVPLHSRSRSA